ncbi:MAG: ABC transporter ATP-binding protein [Spirochaetota bacterium]|nr:MAG: ABC transporter ATP-binding protein [Spirochaetota bacterium]
MDDGHNDQQKVEKKKALRFILSYVKRHLTEVISGIILLMAVDLIQLFIPRIVQHTIDLLGEANFSYTIITQNMIYIILLAFGMVIIRFFWRVLIVGTSRKIEKEVRHDMFAHLQTLSFSYFNRTKTGGLMALMVNDVNAIRMATGPSFIALTDAIFMGSLSLVFMFSIDLRISLFSILPLPIIILMMSRFGPMIQARFKAVQESFAAISSHTQESVSGIRVIKGYAQEKDAHSQFDSRCEDYVEKNIKLIKIWGFFFPSVTLLASLSLAILYLLGGRSVIVRSLSFGEFISLTMYINLLVWPVIAIGWVFNLLQRGVASATRILELVETEPDVIESERVNGEIKEIRGSITIRNLKFSYPENNTPVLDGVNLSIESSSSLGIMGRPGSGKSTLISLLFRLFPLNEGEISIDGYEIHQVPLRVLRGSIGYVPQDPFLFSDTIFNNITFGLGEDEVDQHEVERVSKLTRIYEEIIGFSRGFDTVVGERGVTLSGGQIQRLSIARALLLKPKIIVLDDALSQVDASKEKEILRSIFSEAHDTTIILASHRVSTVRSCDNIVVLDEGRVIESGNHQKLMQKDGFYSRLFNLQRLEEEIV